MNDREALIAAVRAQVEKEKAAKAAQLAKEQEMQKQMSGKSAQSQTTQKFRPWNPDEKKEQNNEQKNEQNTPGASKNETEREQTPGNSAERENSITFEGVQGDNGNKESLIESSPGRATLDTYGMSDEKLGGSDGSKGLKLSEDIFGSAPKKKEQSSDVMKNSDASDEPVLDEQGNVINVIPVEQKDLDPNNVKSMYDIEFSDDEDNKKYEAAKKAEEDRLEAEARKAEAVRKKFAEIEAETKREIEQRKAEEEARRKAEEEARRRAEEEARRKAEEEARRRAEEEARRKAEEERRKAEEEARRKAEEERRKAEEEARRKAEEERRRAEEEARRKAEEEARRRAEEEARRKAEEARRKAEEEERQRVEAEIKRRAEARKKAEEEARKRVEEERQRILEEKRRKAEEDAQRIRQEEARRRAEEEARKKAEEDARKKAEEEARKRVEEEVRRKTEEEAREKAEEEARKKAEEEARKAAEEARKAAEEEARKAAEEEARKKAEEEARKQAEEEARKQAEEEARKKAEEEARKRAEEEIRQKAEAEEAARAADAAKNQMSGLPRGAEEFLGKYMTIDTINRQMKDAIVSIDKNRNEPKNIVILCKHGFGTTNIGIDFAKSYYAMGICKNSTVAVIKAAAFNKVDLDSAVSKLQGGCLVIENAGNVRQEKVDQLADVISNPSNDIAVILIGEMDSLSRLFSSSSKMVPYFKHLIQMHRIDNNAVYEIAQNYIEQLGYKAEARALSKLKNLMLGVEDGNLDRVLKMVNDAISRAEDRVFRELGGAGSSTGQKVLVESDFE